MIKYTGGSMVEAYWEAYSLAEAIKRELPPELLATAPQWPERPRVDIQLDPNGELELVKFSLKEQP